MMRRKLVRRPGPLARTACLSPRVPPGSSGAHRGLGQDDTKDSRVPGQAYSIGLAAEPPAASPAFSNGAKAGGLRAETTAMERQQPRRLPRPRLPVRPGDAALRRGRSDGRPPPLATNSSAASSRAAASPPPARAPATGVYVRVACDHPGGSSGLTSCLSDPRGPPASWPDASRISGPETTKVGCGSLGTSKAQRGGGRCAILRRGVVAIRPIPRGRRRLTGPQTRRPGVGC
jgi:hypothetical protein